MPRDRAAAWNKAHSLGRLGSEWDFDLVLPDGSFARVVPDLAFLSYEKVPRENRAAADVPRMAPTVAFEILSEKDPNRPTVRRKLDLYRDCGAVVVVVDAKDRTISVHEGRDRSVYREGDVLDLPRMPGFTIDVAELFRDADV